MYQLFGTISAVLMILLCIVCILKPGFLQKNCKWTQKLVDFTDKYFLVLLGMTFVAFLLTRLFRLGIVPGGAHLDEMGAAYDAQCIANYGVDRYREWFPVYFKNFGGGQNALYTYLAAFVVKIAGFSMTKFRLVAVICSIPVFWASYDIGKRMYQKWTGLLAAILVTILPVYLMSERWGLESYLLLSFLSISMCFYYRAVTLQKTRDYLLSGLFFGITLYTYAVSYIIIPLFLIFSTLYLIRVKKFDFKKTVALAAPLILLATPLILFQFINMRMLPEIRTPFFSIYRMANYRGGEISFSNIKNNFGAMWQILHYDPTLLYNGLPEFGTVYEMTIPLAFFGLCICIKKTVQSLRKRSFCMEAFVLILFVFAFLAMMIIVAPNVNKANGMFFCILFFAVTALYQIGTCNREILILPLLLYFMTFLSFSNFYYREYNTAYTDYQWFEPTGPGESIAYVRNNLDIEGKNVYVFTKECNSEELQILTFGGVSPYDYVPDAEAVVLGNYVREIPEELDLNEDCVYVIHEFLHHVSDYLAQNGYERVQLPTGYSVLYKKNLP